MIYFIISILLSTSIQAQQLTEQDWVSFYKDHFKLTDVFQKLVDNEGNGEESLYGVRNFRVVLQGIQYRGGGNNRYHRTLPRNNVNPLPQDGLIRLCKQGFGLAIYLYSENFATAQKEMTCESVRGINTLKYISISPVTTPANTRNILSIIYESLLSYKHGPIYTHCWNGWHASGYVSAVSLRQFCGWSAEQAVKYWDINTDGRNDEPQYESIRNKIRTFIPFEDFKISNELQARVCLMLKS